MLEAFKLPNNLPNKVNRKENEKKGNGDVEELGRVGPIERETPSLSASAGFLGTPRMKCDGGCCRDKSTRKGKGIGKNCEWEGISLRRFCLPKEASTNGQMGPKNAKVGGEVCSFLS